MGKPNSIIVLLYIQNSHTKMQAKCGSIKTRARNLAKFCDFVIFARFEEMTSLASHNSQYSTQMTPQLLDIENYLEYVPMRNENEI